MCVNLQRTTARGFIKRLYEHWWLMVIFPLTAAGYFFVNNTLGPDWTGLWQSLMSLTSVAHWERKFKPMITLFVVHSASSLIAYHHKLPLEAIEWLLIQLSREEAEMISVRYCPRVTFSFFFLSFLQRPRGWVSVKYCKPITLGIRWVMPLLPGRNC